MFLVIGSGTLQTRRMFHNRRAPFERFHDARTENDAGSFEKEDPYPHR